MVLTHIFFVLAKYRRKGAGVVCGCGWRKRPGGAGARRAIVARTMPRRGDVGGCGRMRVEGCAVPLKKKRLTFARARGALVKRVVGRALALCVDLHRSRLCYAPPLQVHRTFAGGKGAPVPVRLIAGGLGGACPCGGLVGV
jgi:hypothetical protein